MLHKDFVGDEAVHPAAFVSASDPGAEGAHKFWVDTSVGPPYLLKKRNATDDGWEDVASIGGEEIDLTGVADGNVLVRVAGVWVPAAIPLTDDTLDGDDVDTAGKADGDVLTWNNATSQWEPQAPTGGGGGGDGTIEQFGADAQPGTPNAMDDEFETGSLDAKWNQRNSPTLSFHATASHITVAAPQNSGDAWRFIMQTAPAGAWKVRAKIRINSHLANFRSVGIVVSSATTTNKFMVLQVGASSGANLQVNRWTNWTTFSAAVGTALSPNSTAAGFGANWGGWAQFVYVEIEYDTTNLIFRFSTDGIVFRQLHSETLATFLGAISEVGLGVNTNDNSNGTTYNVCDWFRRIS